MRQSYSFSSSMINVAALLIILAVASKIPQAEARAFFVFGDSLVDNGNNNYLLTSARADSPPYGIDYPTHRPTGRFSNGLNIPDIISTYYLMISFYLVNFPSIYVYQCYTDKASTITIYKTIDTLDTHLISISIKM